MRDRRDAGRLLARTLSHLAHEPDLLVLGLPRGGVVVAAELARALHAPLDVWVVRKLGLPGHEEYAMGAIASGGVQVVNPLPGLEVPPQAWAQVLAREQAELERRERAYRGKRPPVAPRGRHVILVDDGLATGATMRAAAQAVKALGPARLTLATPVGSASGLQSLAGLADAVVCPLRPEPFRAVSLWYEHMPQTRDEEVHELLAEAWGASGTA